MLQDVVAGKWGVEGDFRDYDKKIHCKDIRFK